MTRNEYVQLSKNEQMVLYHLVEYPNYTDHDIYERIGMKQSTYSTIKRKLAEEGYYYTMYAPILQHLGSELLVIWYLTLNRKTHTDERLALTRNDLLAASNLVNILSESNQAIILSISKNIGEHVKVSDHIVQLYEKHDFLDELHYVLFPFQASSVFTFFDFTPLLNRIFKIEPMEDCIGDVDVNSDRVLCKVKHTQMNELEKRVYLGLIRYPNLSSLQLSEKLGCSRQVFTRIKLRFIEEKLIKKRRIVSLEKLGFKMLTMTHTKFNPLKPLKERQDCVREAMTLLTPFFKVARDPESIMLNAFRNFEEFKVLHNEFVHFCTERDSVRGDPVNILMSIPRIHEIKWLVYEPLVRRVLNEL